MQEKMHRRITANLPDLSPHRDGAEALACDLGPDAAGGLVEDAGSKALAFFLRNQHLERDARAVFHVLDDPARGSQYTSAAFRETLEVLHIRQSLSGVDHCYDNARMESFFATLKKELLYRLPTYRMPMEEVKTRVFRYVFIYYNQLRVYTSNPGGWPPAVFRRMQQELAA